MRDWVRSNVAGVVAIFIALGGVAVAADTAPKNSVVSKSIQNGQVKTADLRDGGVGTTDLAEGAVTGAKLAPSAIPASTAPSGPAGGDLSGSFPNPSLGAGKVTTPKLADDSVTTPKLADDSVTTPKLADGSVTPAKTGAVPAARVFRTSSFEVGSGGATATVPFTDEHFDTAGLHDGSEPTRLTAPIDGIYSITGTVRWEANTAGTRFVAIRASEGSWLTADWRQATSGGCCPGTVDQNLATIWRMEAGDYVELDVYQESGGPLDVQINDAFTELAMTWIAPG